MRLHLGQCEILQIRNLNIQSRIFAKIHGDGKNNFNEHNKVDKKINTSFLLMKQFQSNTFLFDKPFILNHSIH
jgi:hypothetical protein